ncbi:MAG: NBR1-Ig-like domain-containing protein, partial [Anaerolineales bacterium]|nr:NBR1-Ig-like domain-containing protein [Anaerolineales bacterium]
AGEIFLKTWQVRNTGTTIWSAAYSLGHFGDDQMGAPDSLKIPAVKPGENGSISVSLRAPDLPGAHQSTWRLRDPGGQFFGDALFALVEVAPPDPTISLVDLMGYVDDVTIADGTKIEPGQTFLKVWRVRNLGTSTWGSGFELVFDAGHKMDGPDSISLPAAKPGETVDIRLPLAAPGEAGTHRSVWKARNPDGEIFKFEVFAEIEVVRDASSGVDVDSAKFLSDVTIQPGEVLLAGEALLKTWRVRNTGTTTWDRDYELIFEAGSPIEFEAEPVPPAPPGAEVNISARMRMPLNPGAYDATWRLQNPAGNLFGEALPLEAVIPSPIPAANQRDGGSILSYETFKPGTGVMPEEEIQVLLRVRNTGTTTWENGYSLVHAEGEIFGGPASQPLPQCEPMRTTQLALNLKMPEAEGDYAGVWRMRGPDGKLFGSKVRVELAVRKGSA